MLPSSVKTKADLSLVSSRQESCWSFMSHLGGKIKVFLINLFICGIDKGLFSFFLSLPARRRSEALLHGPAVRGFYLCIVF